MLIRIIYYVVVIGIQVAIFGYILKKSYAYRRKTKTYDDDPFCRVGGNLEDEPKSDDLQATSKTK